MTATTPHFEIPYPTTDDQIRLIPAQLQALATTVDTTMYGAGPRSGTDLASIDTNNATIGQQAYVYDSDETKKAHAGPYWYYGSQWIRPAQAAVIFDLITNDDWLLESWQWQTFGQPYIYIRAKAKRDIVVTGSNHEWRIGLFTENAYKPPTFGHFPAYTNENHAANFGFQVGENGLRIETFVTGFTFKQNAVVFAMLTWPCPNIGDMRHYVTS